MFHPTKQLATGLFWAATAIAIWSGSLVMLRLGVTTTLNAYDLTALRFGVAALFLTPVIWRQGFALGRLGLWRLLVLVAGFGAPYVLLLSFALETAPASAAGSLNPGLMAVVSVLAGWKLFDDKMRLSRIVGIVLILLGASLFAGVFGLNGVSRGHLLIAVTAVMWASYSLVVRWARIPAWQATAIVAVGSAFFYLPIYFVALPKQILVAPIFDVLLQAVFQGVLVSVVAVFAFNRSAEQLGPIAGACMPALIPIVTLGLGAVVLGETIGVSEIVSTILIGAGVALTLGQPDWSVNKALALPGRIFAKAKNTATDPGL